MKLKGLYFEIVSDTQRKFQVVLDRIKENYLHGFLKCEKNYKITVCIPKGDNIERDDS
jgi:hypothetical protein